MKAEMRFSTSGIIIRIFDVVNGKHLDFGPFDYHTAETLVHDYDKLRAMYQAAQS